MEHTILREEIINNTKLTSKVLYQDSYSKMMYEIFVLSLILTWFPSKALSYASPYIIIFFAFVTYNNYNILLSFLRITSLAILFLGFNYIVRENYIFSNGVLTTITYGPFILIWSLSKRSVSEKYISKIYNAIYFTVIFQSLFGLAQFLIAHVKFGSYTVDMGDFIQGTIVPMSFNLEGDRGIGNAYFVINIVIMMLFILIHKERKKNYYYTLLLGSVAVILAGVHHALISVFISLVIALFISDSKNVTRYIFIIIPVIVTAGMIFYFLNPNNVYLYSHYFNLYASGESFKTLAMKKAIIDLYNDHPNISMFGTGLGQFSSRAGLIASGTYLGGLDENRSIPFFPISQSVYFKEYAFDIYYSMKMDKSTVHGAASRTFFSLMSIYVELGIALFIGLIIYVSKKIYSLRIRYDLFNKLNMTQQKNTVIILISAILFFIFISFFENYLEMNQATLTCFILVKIFYNNTFSPLEKYN